MLSKDDVQHNWKKMKDWNSTSEETDMLNSSDNINGRIVDVGTNYKTKIKK